LSYAEIADIYRRLNWQTNFIFAKILKKSEIGCPKSDFICVVPFDCVLRAFGRENAGLDPIFCLASLHIRFAPLRLFGVFLRITLLRSRSRSPRVGDSVLAAAKKNRVARRTRKQRGATLRASPLSLPVFPAIKDCAIFRCSC